MAFDLNKKTGRPVAQHNYKVVIPEIELEFGVDECSGLNYGTFTEISHRSSGTADMHVETYTGTCVCNNITMSGIFIHTLDDIDKLSRWHDQTAGTAGIGSNIGVLKKDIEIKVVFRDQSGSELSIATGSWMLSGCSLISLDIGALSGTNSEPAMWSITIKPDRVSTKIA